MFPGLATKLSKGADVASTTTITQVADVFRVTGTTAIATITPRFGGQFPTVCVLLPTGIWSTVTTGNIILASTAVVGKAMIMTYLPATGKWYPSY